MIEAAPERVKLKHQLFARLSEVVSADCVLASNTSSLLVTALAPAARHPERVVGMHFFNPPPVMALLEVVAGAESSERALAVARACGEAMGKRVIVAADGPGFLVNRCNRPWGLGVAQAPVRAGGHRGADRPHLPARRRLSHGPVRADGPRRRRRRPRHRALLLRAELRRAALAALAGHGEDGRRRAHRPQVRARLL